jgi:hypothetical protein
MFLILGCHSCSALPAVTSLPDGMAHVAVTSPLSLSILSVLCITSDNTIGGKVPKDRWRVEYAILVCCGRQRDWRKGGCITALALGHVHNNSLVPKGSKMYYSRRPGNLFTRSRHSRTAWSKRAICQLEVCPARSD